MPVVCYEGMKYIDFVAKPPSLKDVAPFNYACGILNVYSSIKSFRAQF